MLQGHGMFESKGISPNLVYKFNDQFSKDLSVTTCVTDLTTSWIVWLVPEQTKFVLAALLHVHVTICAFAN